MIETGTVIFSLAAGFLLGFVFYGGLLWTVHKGISSAHPALWFFTSFWLRIGMVLIGFYVFGDDDWKRLLACLGGFIIARFAVATLMPRFIHAH